MLDGLLWTAYVFGLGPTELIIILVIVLIIFGPRKLPELGKAIGSGLRELRRASESKGEEETEKAKSKEKVEEKEESEEEK
ncbi:MAG: twin-arginine translocase TatA/TatE family subunit [Actinomycetota bacterium]|nr:twin-arginine translocase TatA/TatE family subunit [Actinomycetota bacterium]MDI6821311.1 twin-arginine translocase TatA/TatE family subunit [Actinomycetota bacterium]